MASRVCCRNRVFHAKYTELTLAEVGERRDNIIIVGSFAPSRRVSNRYKSRLCFDCSNLRTFTYLFILTQSFFFFFFLFI